MRRWRWTAALLLVSSLLFFHCVDAKAQAPTIASISPSSGPVGSAVTISGTNFGSMQGNSTVSLNGTSATVITWTGTTIIVAVPSNASSGSFSVTVGGQAANSSTFTITALPAAWSDGDIGSVGVAGSSTYASGVFTVQGSGSGAGGTADSMYFVYQPLSGDGSIVARVVSESTSSTEAGVMIRETLNANAATAYVYDRGSSTSVYNYFWDRTTTGGSATQPGTSPTYAGTLPYWIKLVRSGNTFTAYTSSNGVSWTQVASVSITMATNVYVGLMVSSTSNSSLATATFDSVSASSATSTPSTISSVWPAAAPIGGQVTISGSGFGASQGSSFVALNGLPLTVNSWSDSSISTTIPVGGMTGSIVVYVAPTMDSSNAVSFWVPNQPVSPWLDLDIGPVGIPGSATYENGVFVVQASGTGITGSNDSMHFVFQPLSGDGSIVARVVKTSTATTQAGVMIRETLNANATDAYVFYYNWNGASDTYYYDRVSTGTSASSQGSVSGALPYWMKVVRSGNSFTAYGSPDGVNWTQIGSSQTITMATNVYVGLVTSSANNTASSWAVYDNASLSSVSNPAPTISGIAPTSGAAGTSVTITGSNFGATRGASTVQFDGVVAGISSWSGNSISATVPSPTMTGPVVVTVDGQASNGVTFTAVTTGTLSGAISNSSLGTPISGAQIQVEQSGEIKASASSDSNGNYTFSNLLGGTYDVVVSASGFGRSVSSPVSVPAGVTTTLNVSLSSPGTISGKVTQSDGVTPIAGATIEALVGQASAGSAATDSNGNYTISGLNAGNYSVVAFASGYAPANAPESVTANSTTTANFSLQAQSGGTIQYVYDPLGRLVGVINPSGDTAIYHYDSVGNLQSISRRSSAQLSIISFSPATGSAGATITIYGIGFSPTASQDTVSFNGTNAPVQSASATQLIVTVPSGAVSGPITVSTPSDTTTTASSFTVINK